MARSCSCRLTGLTALAALLAITFPSWGAPPPPRGPDVPSSGEKYALLVAVSEYDKNELRSLQYTENDVTALAQVLKDAGYRRVVVMTQTVGARQARFLPTAGRIRDEFNGLLAERREGDTVLVAFAGHGVQFRGSDEPYFCPMDARLSDRSTLVSLGEVYRKLEQCQAGFKLLLVDACRNDPQSDHSRSRSEVNLESVTRPQRKLPPGGVAALFSCSAGEKAFESPDLKSGVFFHYVIQGLKGKAAANKDGGITLASLTDYVQREVNDHVKDEFGPNIRQVPELVAGKLRGAILLTGSVRTAGPDATPAVNRKPGVLVVRLPAEAKLEINGQVMSQTGEERRFNTAPLGSGEVVKVRLKATNPPDIREVVREAVVRPGEETVIDLRDDLGASLGMQGR